MSGSRSRLVRVLLVVGSIGLLALGALSAIDDAAARARGELDEQITATADEEALALDSYFERARLIDLLLAQNPEFRDFYIPRVLDLSKAIGPRSEDWNDANGALVHIDSLYLSDIVEAGLIDQGGREIAREVRGKAVGPGDLSPDESASPFFGPTLALDSGQVYQTAPYLSPNTGEWVISSSTPLPSTDGMKDAIVHLEVTVDSFRREAAMRTEEYEVVVIDRSTGRVIIDGHAPQAGGAPLGERGPDDYRSLSGTGSPRGVTSIDGRRVGYARITSSTTNENDWMVVVPAPPIAISLVDGLDAGTVLMITGSLILMVVAAASSRGRRRDLQLAATTDALTGLPNRALFADRVDQALLRCRREGSSAAVLLIDLNGFKEVNDTLGHSHGDELLRAVSERLNGSLRESDSIARLGGDEFGLLLPNLSGQGAAMTAAERVTAALAEPIVAGGIPVRLSASVGIAMYPDHGDDVTQLVQHADVAMYGAKGEKVPFTVYSPSRDPFSRQRLGLLADLPRAIEERELILHFQPKVDLSDMHVTGVEALVRWPHPELGLIPPDEFVPLAEETGMIDSLTSLVLDLALERLRAWHDEGLGLGVAVNITERSLVDARFTSQVTTSLRRWGLPASALTLELTESAFVSDPERAIDTARELREMGAAVSIDDFGSGYSSLAYLRDLPVDELKIDRSFISKMLRSESDALIVRSAIVLAHGLGLRVVAEGVEQAAELEELRRSGCDIAQGYLFSRPVPGEEITPMLHRAALMPGMAAPAR